MADFTVIETQEQLDKVIGERLKRAEKQAAEKYADYDDLKKQNAQLTEQVQKHKATVDELNAKVHQYETASVKTKVALEMGLPYQMASRLTGDDEKAIRADAEAMVKLIGDNRPTAPLGSSEPNVKNTEASAWASVSAALNNI
jgi:uncharacterized coiled-coil DUF342 family protein